MANQQKQTIKPTKAKQEALKKQEEISALIERNVKEFKEFILTIDLPKRFVTTGFLILDGDHNYMVINVNPWSGLADVKFMMSTHNFLHGMSAEETTESLLLRTTRYSNFQVRSLLCSSRLLTTPECISGLY